MDLLPEHHPPKQGLKQAYDSYFGLITDLPEHHPPKQGLKPNFDSDSLTRSEASRTSSTKTRIETRIRRGGICMKKQASRTSSTKTRIETKMKTEKSGNGVKLPEHHPPKQGLKQSIAHVRTLHWQLPEHHPPKQGLKHQPPQPCNRSVTASRTSSTKTRIETNLVVYIWIKLSASRTSSTKTRIETSNTTYSNEIEQSSRTSSTKTRIETTTGQKHPRCQY